MIGKIERRLLHARGCGAALNCAAAVCTVARPAAAGALPGVPDPYLAAPHATGERKLLLAAAQTPAILESCRSPHCAGP